MPRHNVGHRHKQLIWSGRTYNPFIAVGLSPISTTSRRNDRIFVAWSAGQLCALGAYIVSIGVLHPQIIRHFDAMGKLNVVLNGSTIVLTHFVLLFESLRTRTALRAIRHHLAAVDARIAEFPSFAGVRRTQVRVAITFTVYSVFLVASEALICATVWQTDEWRWHWWATVWSLSAGRLKHLQHVYFVDELTARFRVLRRESEAVVAAPSANEMGVRESLKRVKVFMDVSVNLHAINDDMTAVFGFSQLVNLTQNFVQLSSGLYWMYGMLYGSETGKLAETFIGLVQTFVVLIVLMNACENCLREVKFIGFLLHNNNTNMSINTKHRRRPHSHMDVLVESYSLQMLHAPIGFPVFGFFDMDFMLLKSMVAAITTYMVIFIQFMPKDESNFFAQATGGNQTTKS